MTYSRISLFASCLLVFLSPPVVAATYPDTCPKEGQAIVEAVGGCAAISCSEFEAICAECCTAGDATSSPSPSVTFILATSILFWGGIGYLIYRLIKRIKRKKAEKIAGTPTESKDIKKPE
ncbi:MAG: hypothetical protein Q7S09_05925 [bacterium]|nr:hypothetical protein [bacterium]